MRAHTIESTQSLKGSMNTLSVHALPMCFHQYQSLWIPCYKRRATDHLERVMSNYHHDQISLRIVKENQVIIFPFESSMKKRATVHL